MLGTAHREKDVVFYREAFSAASQFEVGGTVPEWEKIFYTDEQVADVATAHVYVDRLEVESALMSAAARSCW